MTANKPGTIVVTNDDGTVETMPLSEVMMIHYKNTPKHVAALTEVLRIIDNVRNDEAKAILAYCEDVINWRSPK